MRSRSTILFSILITLTVGLFLLDLAVGAVNIPIRDVWAALTGGNCSRATEKIVLNIRLIKAIVALLAGAALSVSGLQMQTLFRNPLAVQIPAVELISHPERCRQTGILARFQPPVKVVEENGSG